MFSVQLFHHLLYLLLLVITTISTCSICSFIAHTPACNGLLESEKWNIILRILLQCNFQGNFHCFNAIFHCNTNFFIDLFQRTTFDINIFADDASLFSVANWTKVSSLSTWQIFNKNKTGHISRGCHLTQNELNKFQRIYSK